MRGAFFGERVPNLQIGRLEEMDPVAGRDVLVFAQTDADLAAGLGAIAPHAVQGDRFSKHGEQRCFRVEIHGQLEIERFKIVQCPDREIGGGFQVQRVAGELVQFAAFARADAAAIECCAGKIGRARNSEGVVRGEGASFSLALGKAAVDRACYHTLTAYRHGVVASGGGKRRLGVSTGDPLVFYRAAGDEKGVAVL